LESIAATDFNFGVKVLTSCYIHSQEIPCHAHFWFGRSERESIVFKITVLCLTLAVHRSVQEAYSSF